MAMVSDIEYACCRLVGEHLEPGESSLALQFSVDHLGATPPGEEITVRVAVSGLEGRKITLEAENSDSAELAGRGQHVRFVIEVNRHEKRLKAGIDALHRGG